jgi:exonuclease 3'-5' domain-containing protein 1
VRTKNLGRRLFAPELGGTYAVFDSRPLATEIKDYCAQDVAFMPLLLAKYCGKLCDKRLAQVEVETAARIRLSQTSDFNGKGKHMALAPVHWHGAETSSFDSPVRDRVMRLSRSSQGDV